jgi:hypothetical protein
MHQCWMANHQQSKCVPNPKGLDHKFPRIIWKYQALQYPFLDHD